MRRSVFTLATACTVAIAVAFASAAAAVGPGGWSHVGVGPRSAAPSLNGAVYSLNTSDPGVVYAGGNPKAQRIASWSGGTWHALGNTPLSNGAVMAIAYSQGKVYAGGTFVNVGGNADADFLAVWNGSTWAPFCTSTVPGPAFTANVNALKIIGNTLYVGGSFANGAGLAAADYLVACDLTTGAARSTVLNDGDIGGAVYALTADPAGTLYAGGGFINLAGIPEADHVAAFNGSWHAMGAGVDSFVRSMTAAGSNVAGTNVYIGTDSVDVGGIANADHVARWNGTAWSAVGSNSAGTNGWFPASSFIYGLATYGSLVVATGSFQNANGVAAADHVAYFDGASWRPIGSNGAGNGAFIGQGTAAGVVNGQVYVSGSFTSAGGDPLATSLAAYSLRLPDASIGATRTGHFVGRNKYSPTGVHETRKAKVARGKSKTSYVRFANNGLVAASFTITGTGGAHGFTARYFRGTQNITAGVRAGTYSTGSIAARASILLRVVVAVKQSSAKKATFVTTARPDGFTPPDAVRFVVRAKG